jgi:enoyl-CoA hydratase/carnithine racemase
MIEIVLRGRGPNTMSLAMLEQLEREIDAAGSAPVMITGAGDAFSAGLDLDALAKAGPDDVVTLLQVMDRVVKKLFLHPAPTVALVNGHAVAGGCLLVQCCDVRVGADDPDVRIGMTGVAIGLTYPPFVPAIFRARVAPPHLETILLGAQRFAPDRALQLGLLDELAPRTDARALAERHLAQRAKLPSHAYAATKRALRQPALSASADDQQRFEREVLPAWTGALLRRPA